MKLPDKYALGGRPTPTPSSYVRGRTGFETAEGDALKDLGGALMDVAQTIDKVQDRQDKYAAEDAFNQLRDRQMDLAIGDDGFTKKKGEDAVNSNLMEDYGERFEKARGEIGDKLTNPRAKKYYQDRASIAALQNKQDMLRHVTAETEVYQEDVYSTGLAAEHRDIGLRYSDKNAVNQSRARIDGLIDQRADKMGWTKEKVDALKFEHGSKAHVTIIQQEINNKNPVAARKWFNGHKKEIDPELYDDINSLLKNADLTEFGQQFVDNVITQGWDEHKALQEARKLSGEEEEKAKKEVKIYFAEVQAAANDNGWRIYNNTEGAADKKLEAVMLKPGLWDSMSGKEQQLMRDKAKAAKTGAMKTDRKQYRYLLNLIENQPAVFFDQRQTDLTKFVLSDSDFQEFQDLQSGQIKLSDAQTKNAMIKQGLAEMGIDPKLLDDTGSTGNKARKVERELTEEIRRESDAKKRPLSDNEIRDIVDRKTIQVRRNVEWWFDDVRAAGVAEVKGVPKEWVDEAARTAVELGDVNAEGEVSDASIRKWYQAKVELTDMTPEFIEKLRQKVIASGKPPTEANMLYAYRYYFPEGVK